MVEPSEMSRNMNQRGLLAETPQEGGRDQDRASRNVMSRQAHECGLVRKYRMHPRLHPVPYASRCHTSQVESGWFMWMMALFKVVGINYELRRLTVGRNSIKSEALEQPGCGSQNQQMICTFCDRNTWLAPLPYAFLFLVCQCHLS